MSAPLIAGLLDSGVDTAVAPADWPRRSFGVDDTGDDGAPDLFGHGTALARIILTGASPARLAIARIFESNLACTPAAAAAGMDWLLEQGAQIVNMSFGLREDRTVLREACERATAAGIILLGAAPARGPGVYPSSYDGVIRISGDARLRPGEISVLGGHQADFGTCPRPMEVDNMQGKPVGGASFAVAHATTIALPFLAGNPGAGAADLCDYLTSIARFHGPERRKADAPPATPEGDSPCNP